jgi:guanylate kinase
VVGLVRAKLDGLALAVSATTRHPRPGEVDGREYHFLTRAAFEREVARGAFVEWVEYSGDLYGTLRREVHDELTGGADVLLEIELRGARAVRAAIPDAVLVFIAPPSADELARRLRGRGTESEEAVARRLRIAAAEVAAADEFDHVVVNDDAERAAEELAGIINAERKGS